MGRLAAARKKRNALLSLATLGIVYGDIGTSPLYAFRESLRDLPLTENNILGILSLILWTLILVISVKYISYVLRADNDGEGGVLALLALLKRYSNKSNNLILIIAILGAGLLFGDGMLTPAMSVLSSVEGLSLMSPTFTKFVMPITLAILILLFLSQHHGTAKIGIFFGPIITLWFLTIAMLGIRHIIIYPQVLWAISPSYAAQFFIENNWLGYKVLGSIFLVVTGGEALYADLGHFGRKPITICWFAIVLPSLILNYFGQGANVLQNPEAIINPFYALAPDWFAYPLIILATMATIIASQAVISATFSLINQAILLELCPRMPIVQKSRRIRGQIYIGPVNWILCFGAILLVIGFGSSSNLAHAYGIAVNLVMLAVTILLVRIAEVHWHWSKFKILSIFSVFVCIDISFLGANLEKVLTGGWVPLLFAAIAGIVMITWKTGMRYLHSSYYVDKIDLASIAQELNDSSLSYIKDFPMVFITDPYDRSGGALLHYLKLSRAIPENILLVSPIVVNQPYVAQSNRCVFNQITPGVYRLNMNFGFMEIINLPHTLSIVVPAIPEIKNKIDIRQATFLVEITNIVVTHKHCIFYFSWQEKLFEFLMRISAMDIEFLKLPHNRTIAIGSYCEI
ncbi:MAG: KUP/HAK/KT family potassium transporter [Gammaproteobacteria bacterium]|nr:KUP/HAK/KT family potassium transporter [Gammaproteobacteria bacterium]